jgi:hypothetical protein
VRLLKLLEQKHQPKHSQKKYSTKTHSQKTHSQKTHSQKTRSQKNRSPNHSQNHSLRAERSPYRCTFQEIDCA